MASKRHQRRKQCGDKLGWTDQTKAVAHCIALERKDGARMTAYKCHFCHRWHVGHRRHNSRTGRVGDRGQGA